MKTSVRYFTTVLCLAAAVPGAWAADQEKEIKQELRVLPPGDDDHVPQPQEPVTFLGIATSPVSPELTDQLGLVPDMGLVVSSVAPGSPAAAVLKPHDILLKLDDQKLIEPRQLAVLVHSHKEGDEVTLTYLRSGKEVAAKVKLGKHDAPRMGMMQMPGGAGRGFGEAGDFPGLPREEMDRILPLMDMGREMRTRIIRPGPDGEGRGVTVVNPGNSNMVLSDEAGTLEVKIKDGKKDILAKNPKGDVVFSGPYNTDAERQAAPPEVRARLDKLEHMEGINVQADGDFHSGDFDVVVPSGHRIDFHAPAPAPGRALLPPRAALML